jgi:glycogen debranching enzyme
MLHHTLIENITSIQPSGVALEGIHDAIKSMDWCDLQVALYRAETEEQETISMGTYHVDGIGSFVYGGLQGTVSPMLQALANPDHPLAKNVASGDWLMDYHIQRLEKYQEMQSNLIPYIQWLKHRFNEVKKEVPDVKFTKFAQLITDVFYSLTSKAGQDLFPAILHQCSDKVTTIDDRLDEGEIKAALSMCTLAGIQMVGRTSSNSLFPLEYRVGLSERILQNPSQTPSMAAGLPHFSTNYMRQWGRDIFLSVPGILLLGKGKETLELAKACIISAASIMRHGLIPNLIDSGRGPRYNARDAVHYWLYCVQLYWSTVENITPGAGKEWLDTIVLRRFVPTNAWQFPATVDLAGNPRTTPPPQDAEPDAFCHWESPSAYAFQSTIGQLIMESLTRHFEGISYVDSAPDHAMSDAGRSITVSVDDDGFVGGGSNFNCGTWMDKMGDAAVNRGHPATPRDGCAVEFQGLLYSTLVWLQAREDAGDVPKQRLDWGAWAQRMKQAFVPRFYIPRQDEQVKTVEPHPEHIFHREIFKDTITSSQGWTDYQFRPNFLITMVAAPEMCDNDTEEGKARCRNILKQVGRHLVTPMGMRTLSPLDSAYRAFYNPAEEGNFDTAHGLNYHQGPAWQWPLGFYLRAMHLWFIGARSQGVGDAEKEDAINLINDVVLSLHDYLLDWSGRNPWAGLPELQQGDGSFCAGSSPTQAWSLATMSEAFSEMLSKSTA